MSLVASPAVSPDDAPTALLAAAQAHYAASRWLEGRACAERAWSRLSQAPAAAVDAALQRQAALLMSQGLYRTGALSQVVDQFEQLAPVLRAGGPSAALVDYLRMVSLGGADTHRFDIALTAAQEALQVAHALGDLGRISLATTALACVFERSGDPWQAQRLLHEALALARRQPEQLPLFVALNNLGGVLIGMHYLLRDAVPMAEAREPLRQARTHLEAAVAIADARGDPFYRIFTHGNLGEILVHLGELSTAAHELETARTLALTHGLQTQQWRIQCSLGELALAADDRALARRRLADVLASAAAAEHPDAHLRARHALWRAAAADGRADEALAHLQAYVALERRRSVRQLRAQSELFVTRIEAEQARLDARRHRQRASELERDVQQDPLTGLGNRRALQAAWPLLLQRALDDDTPLAVAMIDLDHFKQVNDRHGHAVGDRVLAALGALLRAHTRHADLLVRVGGEEFLLVMPETPPARALEVCERLRERVAQHPWATVAPGLSITLSLGLANGPPLPPHGLLTHADVALYRAKRGGRNSIVVADDDAAADTPAAAD